jgi:diguanylate cyclase (GGDEF)-like protein
LILVVTSTFVAARHLGPWAAALASGLGTLAIGHFRSNLVRDLRRSLEDFARLAVEDDLTGLGNDRGFRADLLESGSITRPGLIVLDLDRFKDYNDAFGHPAGDEALKAIGSILKANVGGEDRVYRLGGDEFAVLSQEAGFELAEHLRRAIEAHSWPLRAITASFGVVASREIPQADLIDRADRAIYRAKREGGNRVDRQGPGEPIAD